MDLPSIICISFVGALLGFLWLSAHSKYLPIGGFIYSNFYAQTCQKAALWCTLLGDLAWAISAYCCWQLAQDNWDASMGVIIFGLFIPIAGGACLFRGIPAQPPQD